MKFWENRHLSSIIMIIVIVVSILLGSHRTLMSMYNKTTVIFYNGVDNDGYGIQSELDRMIDSSSKLLSMASIYFIDSDIQLVDDATQALNDLSDADSIKAKYQTYLILDTKISLVYYALANYELTQVHQISKTTLYYDIAEVKEQIGHNEYNTYTDEYNAALNNFPANILSKVTFVSHIEDFR